MLSFIEHPTRHLFFTGKGGVGKTSIATATAIALADQGLRVLLVSTDPASNLGQVLGTNVAEQVLPVEAVPGLFTLNIDPEAAAAAYRDRVLAPVRDRLPKPAVRQVEEQLSGACTTEIAAFDEFTQLLTDPEHEGRFDHVVFDTAPTGHTLRLLALPSAWSTFIDDNPDGASCLGPLSGLESQPVQYKAAVEALNDPRRTTLVLVSRPARTALNEAARSSSELEKLGVANQRLVVNGVFQAVNRDDAVALALERRSERALAAMPDRLKAFPREDVPLQPHNLLGLEALRALVHDPEPHVEAATITNGTAPDLPSLAALVDELEAAGKGLVVVDGMTLTRIDPQEETRRYTEHVLATKGKDLDEERRKLLEEDLRSPCTEEVAVFHAFSRAVREAARGFVVVDTAPTGHTLLLLDQTGSYHREVLRNTRVNPERIITPLMRLQDPAYTKLVFVTLPETTPVLEAADLQAELRRAEVEPLAWVINQSLAATDTRDPLLLARARAEASQIEAVRSEHAGRVFLAPWMEEEPIGREPLFRLANGSMTPNRHNAFPPYDHGTSDSKTSSFLDRYLTLWIFPAMGVGVLMVPSD